MQFEPIDMLYRRAAPDAQAWRPPGVSAALARLSRQTQDARFVALCRRAGAGVWQPRAVRDEDLTEGYRVSVAHASGGARLFVKASGHGVLAMALQTSIVDLSLAKAVLTSWLGGVLGTSALDIIAIERVKRAVLTEAQKDTAGFALPAEFGCGSVVVEHIDDALRRCLQLAIESVKLDYRPPFGALTLPGSLTIGEQLIAPSLLQSLMPGDVLIGGFDTALSALVALGHTSGDAVFTAYWGMQRGKRLGVKMALQPRSLTVLDLPYMSDFDAPHQNEDAAHFSDVGEWPNRQQQAPLVQVNQLEVPVQFEVATVCLTLDYLSALEPGHVIELPNLSQEVEVRLIAFGQTLGFGTLVSVGEHIGLKIVKMAPENGSVQ